MSDTTFSKGTQFGGDNDFKVKHGGNIRYSFPVDDTTLFLEGNCLELHSDGQVQLSTAQNTKLTAITSTRRSPLADMENDQTIGSGKATVIIDRAIVETKELTSGAVFAINSKVYQDEAGHWTNTQPGTDTRVFGVALAAAVANAGDILTMDYYGAQGPA